MSIMSAYKNKSFAEKATALKRLLDEQSNSAQQAQLSPNNSENTTSALGSNSSNHKADATPGSAHSGLRFSDSSHSSEEGQANALVEVSDDAPSVRELDVSPAIDESEVMQQVMRDLAERGELHKATMRAIESTEEWKGYDAHVTFELLLLRHRYQSTDTPMTAARRSQMQAHLRQKQQVIMEEHAEKLADKFVASLTGREKEEFRAKFLRLDASPLALGDHVPSAPKVTMEEMRAALDDVGSKMRDPQFLREWDTAVHHLSSADLGAKAGGGRDGDGDKR